MTGTVCVKLYKGTTICAGLKSPESLYNSHIATMEAEPTKDDKQDDATGFIRLNGLRLKSRRRVSRTISSAPSSPAFPGLNTMQAMDIPKVERRILEIIRELQDEGRL